MDFKNKVNSLQMRVLPSLQRGVVLPVALVLLVVISFAGILAVRNSANAEQMSNNLRLNVQANQAAEVALKYGELVAMEEAGTTSTGNYNNDIARIVALEVASPNDANAAWQTRANWNAGAVNLISVPNRFYQRNANTVGRLQNAPTCIIQRFSIGDKDGFLITARGLSNTAQLDNNGSLTSGSEVWLQSILTPED